LAGADCIIFGSDQGIRHMNMQPICNQDQHATDRQGRPRLMTQDSMAD
jgi:hypothetical protein